MVNDVLYHTVENVLACNIICGSVITTM